MCFYFSIFHQQNNIILLLKYTCAEFISIKLPCKIKSNNRKKYKIILVFGKATQAIVKLLVAVRIKKILVKVKLQH